MSTVYLLCTMPAVEEQNLEQRIICPRCLLHEERDALPGICNNVRPSAPIIHRGRSNLLNKPRLNNVLAQFVERESGREYAMTTPPVVPQMWDYGGWERITPRHRPFLSQFLSAPIALASPAGVFRGDRISSLKTPAGEATIFA